VAFNRHQHVAFKEVAGEFVPKFSTLRISIGILTFFIFSRHKGEKTNLQQCADGSEDDSNHCAISAEGEKLLENAVTRLGLSGRSHERIFEGVANDGGSGRIEKYRAETPERSDSV
jgi:hypothetical protein